MPSVPNDVELYAEVKKDIYRKYPVHSAYRSGHLVREYKDRYAKKHGKGKSPYNGDKSRTVGLKRWFAEKWSNQRGESGYKYKSDVYRPTVKVTEDTPVLLDELTEEEIERSRREKYSKGRVHRFKNRKTVKKGGSRKTRISNHSSTIQPSRSSDGKIHFLDYPGFCPNLTPREIFRLGSFGGTYWRPIKSMYYKRTLRNKHKVYPSSWWANIPESFLSHSSCDINVNKYKVRVGTSLDYWEEKGWVNPSHPYGWVQWYCDFYSGKRSSDDKRQIDRWSKIAGPKGRFFRYLVTLVKDKGGEWNDESISPKIRQTLQHWAYTLNKKDFEKEEQRRKGEKR